MESKQKFMLRQDCYIQRQCEVYQHINPYVFNYQNFHWVSNRTNKIIIKKPKKDIFQIAFDVKIANSLFIMWKSEHCHLITSYSFQIYSCRNKIICAIHIAMKEERNWNQTATQTETITATSAAQYKAEKKQTITKLFQKLKVKTKEPGKMNSELTNKPSLCANMINAERIMSLCVHNIRISNGRFMWESMWSSWAVTFLFNDMFREIIVGVLVCFFSSNQ